MKDKVCLRCKKKLPKAHPNRKHCNRCIAFLRKYIPTTMNAHQIKKAKSMIGQFSRQEIAASLEVSISNLKRAFRGTRMPCKRHNLNRSMALEVSQYYEVHGLAKTQKKFPEIRVRSIVESYKLHNKRQIKWKESELLEVVKMVGLVSLKNQAKYFNRPLANQGSILSAHSKVVFKKISKSGIHGLYRHKAVLFVKKTCPYINTQNLVVSDSDKSRFLYLWSDMEKHLRKDCPDSVVVAIKTGTLFQKWLFKSSSPRKEIIKMIKDRV